MERYLASPKYRQIWRNGAIISALAIATWFLLKSNLNPSEVYKTTTLLDTTTSDDGESNDGSKNVYGTIIDKVAVISDTQYTPRLIPLILHFHAILGPSWPILFYTSSSTITNHLLPTSPFSSSAIFHRAIADKRIQIRTIPKEFNLTSRNGVNLYLSRPWLWEQLAPAKNVLIFQADSMLCANAHKTIDDFLSEGWDWIAAPLHGSDHLYNGGLSLRNRSMILSILSSPENNWEQETAKGTWTMGGEDVWFSRKMDQRGARLPEFREAVRFACQHDWHTSVESGPAGYHKVHKNINKEGMERIAGWCPEIALAAPGTLEPST